MTMSDEDVDWNTGWGEDSQWSSDPQLSSMRQGEEPPWQTVMPRSPNSWDWPLHGGGGFYSMQRNLRDMTPNRACRHKSHGHAAELMTIGVHEKKRHCCNRFRPLSDTRAEVEIDAKKGGCKAGAHDRTGGCVSITTEMEIEAKKVGCKPKWMKPPGLEPLIAKTKSELLAARAAQRRQKKERRKEYKNIAKKKNEQDELVMNEFTRQDQKKQEDIHIQS